VFGVLTLQAGRCTMVIWVGYRIVFMSNHMYHYIYEYSLLNSTSFRTVILKVRPNVTPGFVCVSQGLLSLPNSGHIIALLHLHAAFP